MLTAEQVVKLCDALEAANVPYWVIGGWGVDALLGRVTRPHKDLDIVALVDDLPQLRRMLDDEGLVRSHVWKQSRWIEDAGEPWPTAFVAEDAIGRALDIHLIEILDDGRVRQPYEDPWPLPEPFGATGTIVGRAIPCVSRAAQVKMHTGYAVPDVQRLDLELLRGSGDIARR